MGTPVDSSAPNASSIFGAAAAGRDKNKPKEKRTKLTELDTVAKQAMNPYGISIIDEQPLVKVYRAAQKGNKWAAFHAELCSDDVARQGIYWSRFCETHVNIITALKERDDLRACINVKVLTKAIAEADVLLPHFARLNTGKMAMQDKDEDTFGGLKRRKANGAATSEKPTPSPEEIEESATALFGYIEQGTASNLRMLINFLSSGGVFYAGQAMDLTVRGWHEDANPRAASVINALKARHAAQSSSTNPAGPSKRKERATGGLFD